MNRPLAYTILMFIIFKDIYSKSRINDQLMHPFIDDLYSFLSFLSTFTESIFDKTEMMQITPCIESLKNIETFSGVFQASGKELGDPGFERNCISYENYTYYLFIYSVTEQAFPNKNEWEVAKFLKRNKDYFTGFCINQECQLIMQVLQNSNAFHLFLQNMGIHNLTINKTDKLPPSSSGDYLPYQILLYSLIALLFLMVFAYVFSFILKVEAYSTRNQRMNEELIVKSPNKVEEDIAEFKFSSNLSLFSNMDITTGKISLRAMDDEVQTKTKVLNVLNYFSIQRNVTYLFEPSNLWFNMTSLEFLSVLRSVFLCMIAYNHSYYAFIRMMEEDFFNIDFYTSPLFGIIKGTIYGIDFSIVLDSFIASYKLMWYLKKNCYDVGQEVRLKSIATFSLLLIPKILTFFVEYYLIYFFTVNVACDLNTTPYRLFYHATISVGAKDCEKQSWLILIPFYLQYKDYLSEKPHFSFSTCFRYCLIYQNELICFIVLISLIYIINKIKSKIFDYFIGSLVLLGIILTFLDFIFLKNKSTTFDLNFFLGQTFTLKYTHMFFPIYMLGAFAGIIYFYYDDSVTSKPLRFNGSTYIPFEFCFKLMQLIDYIGKVGYYIITLICWGVFIGLSLIFYFYRNWYTSNHIEAFTRLTVPINPLMNFFYYYDRAIIVTFFLIFLLLQLMKSKHVFIRYLGAFKLMMLIARVSFSALFCADSIIYISLIAYDLDSMMSYSDCFVLTIGVFFINIIICSFLTIIIEIPLRVLVKMAMRNIVSKKKSSISKILAIKPLSSVI